MNIKTSHQRHQLDILVKEYYHRQLSEGCILPSHFQLIFAEPSIGRAEEQLAGCVNTKQWLSATSVLSDGEEDMTETLLPLLGIFARVTRHHQRCSGGHR